MQRGRGARVDRGGGRAEGWLHTWPIHHWNSDRGSRALGRSFVCVKGTGRGVADGLCVASLWRIEASGTRPKGMEFVRGPQTLDQGWHLPLRA
jgi:hypothetical protein